MPTSDEHVILEGQRAIASVGQEGPIIYDGGATDIHCIVNVGGKAQRAIKVAPVGGSESFIKDVVYRKDVLPEAKQAHEGMVCLYSGETNSTYSHGYIYECKAAEPEYEAVFYFEPAKIANPYYDKAAAFLQEATEDFKKVVSGTMEYLKSGNIWDITLKDSAGNTILDDYKLYTEDLVDSGFITLYPIEDFEDGEVISFEVDLREISDSFSWVRIDVQP